MKAATTRIVGVGRTKIGKLHTTSSALAIESINLALKDANMGAKDIDAVLSSPSFSEPRVMQAHYLATASGLVKQNPKILSRTIDCGGASPITCIGSAMDMIRKGWAKTALVVCTDAVKSMGSKEFLARVSSTSAKNGDIPEPYIPNSYSRYAEWEMKTYGVTREQLAMVTVLMSGMASKHPDAMCKKPYTLDEVLQARKIAPTINLYECARLADGAVALVISSEDHYKTNFSNTKKLDGSKPAIWGVGESASAIAPPPLSEITPEYFSAKRAAQLAYKEAGLTPKDIQFFGLYDCYPICFLHALEGVGLCEQGKAGEFVEKAYHAMVKNNNVVDPNTFPINTHGGLMCFGAPWEVPAMYNITEGIAQLSGAAGERQITPQPKFALAYGNGGVLSASSVAIIGAESPN